MPDRPWPEDQHADLGGRRLRYWAAGSGSPAIVIESGLGTAVVDWAELVPMLAERGRTLAYDRAGLGASDPDAAPRTAGRIVDDLRSLLDVAGVRPPYVLVGHSWGGLITRLFAHRHPDEVVGLVLIDPTHEDSLSASSLRMNKVSYAVLHLLARFGLLPRLLRRAAPVTLYGARERAYVLDKLGDASMAATARREAGAIGASLAELSAARAASPLPAIPVVVLSAGGSRARRWPAAGTYERLHRQHAELSAEGIGGFHRVVDGASHHVHLHEPALVLAAVDHVLAAVRSAPVE